VTDTDEMISAIILVLITIFRTSQSHVVASYNFRRIQKPKLTFNDPTVPPVGVYVVAGCGPDLLINIALTILGYFPGHIHAFYVIYVYYNKKEQASEGFYDNRPAPGVFSDNVQTGGQVSEHAF
jgi:uncharacterized membrane protein YqaE (UPF0057 family)